MTSLILTRARIYVFGKVRGVGFRFSAKIKARSLGLTGWVKNFQNHVEILVEGEKKAVEQMIAWCKEGPSTADVDDVKVEYMDYKGEFEYFEIR